MSCLFSTLDVELSTNSVVFVTYPGYSSGLLRPLCETGLKVLREGAFDLSAIICSFVRYLILLTLALI